MLSHTLTPTERGYNVWGRELLAIVYTFHTWRHICLLVKGTIDVYMEHNNLTYYQQPQKINWGVAYYLMELEEYNFRLIHMPSRANKANHLS